MGGKTDILCRHLTSKKRSFLNDQFLTKSEAYSGKGKKLKQKKTKGEERRS